MEEKTKIIEALLFAAREPLAVNKIKEILDDQTSVDEVEKIVLYLTEKYIQEKSPIRISEVAGGYVLRTHEKYHPYIERLQDSGRREKLSPATSEVLAIIAYKQPVTRAQIEQIRGVDSSSALNQLTERNLIMSVGKLEAPGRPTLYGVTKEFLRHFGLYSIQDLHK